MKTRISSITCALVGLSLFATVPALAAAQQVFGVAVTGDSSSDPMSTLMMTDPATIKGNYAPGYMLTGVKTTPSAFGGMNWSAPGTPLQATDAGFSAPDHCSASFEVVHGELDTTSPLNPNLTIVIQEATTGDYFFAGRHQGVTPTFNQTKNGWDLFTITATNAQFAPVQSGTNTHVLTKLAVVWSGWNDTLPPINSIYVTRPLINSLNNMKPPVLVDNVPAGGKYVAGEENVFNFQ